MSMLRAGDLSRRLLIERPEGDDSFRGAGKASWIEVATVWAQVVDVLPSRAERLDQGINVSQRPCRVRMRFRRDVTADMRFVLEGRILQIVAGPAEIGRREGLEFMAIEYSSAGNPA